MMSTLSFIRVAMCLSVAGTKHLNNLHHNFLLESLRGFLYVLVSWLKISQLILQRVTQTPLSHGEGWGRTNQEAMAMGLPAIVPVWGGVTGYVREDVIISVKVFQNLKSLGFSSIRK